MWLIITVHYQVFLLLAVPFGSAHLDMWAEPKGTESNREFFYRQISDVTVKNSN